MPFNEAQSAAVSHKDGPMMVLAGPGSGKTTVVTHRVQSLIEKHGVNPPPFGDYLYAGGGQGDEGTV